jgi:hypothetical protein
MKLRSIQLSTISAIIGILLIWSTPLQSIDVREFHLTNFEKSYATLEPAISNCAEDEFFNEETQLCEKSNDEDSVVCGIGEEYDPETKTCYDPAELRHCDDEDFFNEDTQTCEPIEPEPETCADDEYFDQTTEQCEPIEPEPETCADDEFLNDDNKCEPISTEDPEPELLITCAVGEIINETTDLCEPIVCATGELLNGTSGLCEPIVCATGELLNGTSGLCEPIVCATGELFNITSFICEKTPTDNPDDTVFALSESVEAIDPKASITTDFKFGIIDLAETGNLNLIGIGQEGSGKIIDYEWKILNPSSNVRLSSDSGEKTVFMTFAGAASGSPYNVQLTVTDEYGRTAIATESITVCSPVLAGSCEIPPDEYVSIKVVGSTGTTDHTVKPTDVLTLKAMVNNPSGGLVSLLWSTDLGVFQDTLLTTSSSDPVALLIQTAPPYTGFVTVQATFASGHVAQDSKIIEIISSDRTSPKVDAAVTKSQIKPGEPTTLMPQFKPGNPINNPPNFKWTAIEGDVTKNAIGPSDKDGNAKWIAPAQVSYPQKYVFKIEASDSPSAGSAGATASDTVEVEVIDPKPPVADKPKPPNPKKPNDPGNPKKPNDPGNPKKPNDPGNPKKSSGPITSTTIVDSFKDKAGSKSTLDSNKIIRTTGTNCLPLSDTLTLGPNTIAPKNFKVLADFDKCSISDATIILNIPQNLNLKLAAGNFDKPNNVVVVPTKDIKTLPTGNKMTQVDIQTRVMGQDLFTKQMKAITNVDGLILWNDSPTDSIILTKDDNGIITAQFAKPAR